jgi:glycosyltransferase involved in cell wall biosynthesis
MNMFISGLLKNGHSVKVLAVNSFKYNVTEKDIPEEYQQKTGIELIDVDLRLKPADALYHLIAGKSYHISRFNSPHFARRLIELLKAETFDIVQLETIFMGPYLPLIRKFSDAKVVLRAHNIEHLIWKRIARESGIFLKKWYINQLARTLEAYEETLAVSVDGIIPITEHDAQYFKGVIQTKSHAHLNNPEVYAIPFGMDIDPDVDARVRPQTVTLFSLGSMNWIPNQEGIKWFLIQVWPEVHRRFPNLKYYLAGREMPEWMVSLSMPDVEVCGEVPDAGAFMADHSIMIVPLFSGSGIRIKIIEGMAAGKVIISTTIGAEGIDYEHMKNILIADTPGEFIEMISLCLRHPEKVEELGKSARELIGVQYHPGELIRKVVAFYEQLLH